MTYHDPNGSERHDRMITVYQFDQTTAITVNLTCNGDTPQIVVDLGAAPLELELVTNDVVALDALIIALGKARTSLLDHQADHAWEHEAMKPSIDEPLYVPDTWTTGTTDGTDRMDDGGDSA